MTYLFQSVVLWMKAISYHHVMRDLRSSRDNSVTGQDGRLSRRASRDSMRDLLDKDDNGKSKELSILQEVKDIKLPVLRYPDNLTVPNIFYFSVAPTLTYQPNYPRQGREMEHSIDHTVSHDSSIWANLICCGAVYYAYRGKLHGSLAQHGCARNYGACSQAQHT